MRSRVALRAVLLGVCLAAAGCFEEVPFRELAAWELEAEGTRAPVVLPRHLGHGLDAHAATYRLRATVPIEESWRGQDLTFTVSYHPARLALRVNGHEVPYLDEHVFDRLRMHSAHRFRIDGHDTQAATMEVELTVDSWMAQATWWDEPPRLARGPYGDARTRLVRIWNVGTAWISLVALLTFAFIYWILHLAASRRGATGTSADNKNTEFAKLAGGASLYPAVQLGLFQPIIGRRDLAFIVVALLIAVKASIQLTRKYLGRPLLPRWSSRVILLSTLTLLALGGGFLGTWWIYVVTAMTFGVIAYVGALTFRGVRPGEGTSGVRWIVVYWAVVLLLAVPDILTGVGVGTYLGGAQLTCFSLLVFVQGHAAFIGRDHTNLLVEQAALNRELGRRVAEAEAHNREIEVLNDELRRKVGDRSRELSAALRKLRTDAESALEAGTVLGDHYRVVGQLGAGAMGAVYRVERLTDGRSLAVKVVRGRPRPDTLERLMREAELAARIDHPHVVRVYDVDVTGEGELFLVMELVSGRSLEQERARFGERVFAETVLAQIASALAAIHEGGVVHRDLKPANVLVSFAGGVQAKVADFGIAGVGEQTGPVLKIGAPDEGASEDEVALGETVDAPPSSPKLTQTGAVMGTPLYMAPEVLRAAGPIGAAADLFSLGLIAYQLFGGAPLERDGRGGWRGERLPFATLVPDLDAATAALLERCLADDPARRPTARALADALIHGDARAVG